MPKREIRIIRGREGYGFTLSGEAPCIVSWISESSYAKDAGLKVGDCVISINKEEIYNAEHDYVVEAIGMSSGVLLLEVGDNDMKHSLFTQKSDDIKNFRNSSASKTNSAMSESQSKLNDVGDSKFYRTKRVLKELKNGSLFQSVFVALDSSPAPKDKVLRTGTAPRMKARTSWPSNEDRGDNMIRSNSLRGYRKSPDCLFLQAIVSYLGKTSSLATEGAAISDICLSALKTSIRQLRSEQDIHQRVLLKLTTKSLKVFNANGDLMELVDGSKLCFCCACEEDERFFSLAVLRDGRYVDCHQFMVDPGLCEHHFHSEQAKRFGIHCTVDSRGCLEFPISPDTIVQAVDMLYGALGDDTRLNQIPLASNRNLLLNSDPIWNSGDDACHKSKDKSSLTKLNKKNMSKSSESVCYSDPDYTQRTSTGRLQNFNGKALGCTCYNMEAWSVSFDRLLKDPVGLQAFSEYLCKEFSEENITFWIDCESLKNTSPSDEASLASQSRAIHEKYLSSGASSPVNIDSSAQRLAEEAIMAPPYPNMFLLQQNQIYKLMEYDSYPRFLKSTAGLRCQGCQVSDARYPSDKDSVSGTPQNETERPKNLFSLQSRKFFQKKNKKSKSMIENRKANADFESVSVVSTTDDETHASSSCRRSADLSMCKLVFWDGSTDHIPVAAGKMTIREALVEICKKRNVPVSAVDVYYHNEDRALALDQDIAVLAGQEAHVERRTLFKLDLHPIGRSIGVKAKPTKLAIDVLKPVLAKYDLDCDQVMIKISGEGSAINLEKPVSMLDGCRVSVDNDFSRTMSRRSGTGSQSKVQEHASQSESNSDTEELILAMSAAESGKLNDQCGLLSQVDLELPDFLKLPSQSPNSNPQDN